MSTQKKSVTKILILFAVSLGFMLLFSVSFLLMSPGSDMALNTGKKWLQILSGAMFWLSLIAAYVLFGIVSAMRKKQAGGSRVSPKHKLPGIITFFSSKEAMVLDILTVVFLVALLVCWFGFKLNNMVVFVFVALFILAFQLRAVFNGENYRYIKSQMSGGKKDED